MTSKRRSYYDEAYEKSERRYEVIKFIWKDIGKSMKLLRVKSKISNLVKSDKFIKKKNSLRKYQGELIDFGYIKKYSKADDSFWKRL